MAALLGRWLNCAVCLEWQHDCRAAPPGTGYLVRHTIPMVEALGGRKVNATNSNGLTANNSQPAETNKLSTNDLDFPTGERQRKVEINVIARLALAGHVVHRGNCNDYTVCKYGFAQYCQDLAELAAFAIRLGVRNV